MAAAAVLIGLVVIASIMLLLLDTRPQQRPTNTTLFVSAVTPLPIEPTAILVEPIAPEELVLVEPQAANYLLVEPGPAPLLVEAVAEFIPIAPEAPPMPAWQEKGWVATRDNHEFHGHYLVHDDRTGLPQTYRGIVRLENQNWQNYVLGKPGQMAWHPKAACFQPFQANPGWEAGTWFRVNWINGRNPENVDEAILKVECYFDEAVNNRPMR